jgi:hypothetical protein
MDLHLEDDQIGELHNLLLQALGELSSEIADTDNPSFLRDLRERRRRLQSIAQQLAPHAKGMEVTVRE